MNKVALAYIVTAVAFCALDFVWLGLVAPKFYQAQIGPLLLQTPKLIPAIVFYALYVAGLVYFCVLPGLDVDSLSQAMLRGALFGLVAYATYDLSNLATLKNWTLQITLVDMGWGCIASAVASAGGYMLTRFFSSGVT